MHCSCIQCFIHRSTCRCCYCKPKLHSFDFSWTCWTTSCTPSCTMMWYCWLSSFDLSCNISAANWRKYKKWSLRLTVVVSSRNSDALDCAIVTHVLYGIPGYCWTLIAPPVRHRPLKIDPPVRPSVCSAAHYHSVIFMFMYISANVYRLSVLPSSIIYTHSTRHIPESRHIGLRMDVFWLLANNGACRPLVKQNLTVHERYSIKIRNGGIFWMNTFIERSLKFITS